MAIKLTSIIWDHSHERAERLLVLLALADYADDKGYCFPSRKSIAKKARISEPATSNIINDFIKLGYLERTEGGLGRGNISRYRIKIEAIKTGIKGNPALPIKQSLKGNPEGVEKVILNDIKGNPERCAYKEEPPLTVREASEEEKPRAAASFLTSPNDDFGGGAKFYHVPPPPKRMTPKLDEVERRVYEILRDKIYRLGESPLLHDDIALIAIAQTVNRCYKPESAVDALRRFVDSRRRIPPIKYFAGDFSSWSANDQ